MERVRLSLRLREEKKKRERAREKKVRPRLNAFAPVPQEEKKKNCKSQLPALRQMNAATTRCPSKKRPRSRSFAPYGRPRSLRSTVDGPGGGDPRSVSLLSSAA